MLTKNLENFSNIQLKNRLLNMSLDDTKKGVSFCVTPSNDYVLLKDDVPIDDIENPKLAVQKHLKSNIKSEMKSNDKIVVFGIGLGYLLDEVFNEYPSKIFLYEPDVELLHFVLNNVDISEHLSSGRVYVSCDMDDIITKLSESYISKDKIEIVYLQNYAIVKNQEMLLLTQKVFDACKSKMVDINTITKFSQRWLDNTLNNVANINKPDVEVSLLSDLENKFLGQTALIAGAGPSLNDNISNIQKNRNKFVIFAVNKSVPFLTQNGIYPDFVVCLDAGNMQKTLDVPDEYIARMNCIFDIRTDKTIFNKKFKKMFVEFSDSDTVSRKMATYNKSMNFYETGGSASTLAFVSAVKLGFSKIILAGIDLAFKENVIYANGEIMKMTTPDEIVVDGVRKPIVKVPSVSGGVVSTREDYQAFIQHFETLIKDLAPIEVYNISSFGANIKGAKNVHFESIVLSMLSSMQAVNVVEPCKIDVENFIKDEFFNINNIISILSKGVFSPALVSSIVKSVLIYQYMQAEIITVLQKNFEPQIADDFISKTKAAIKNVVDLMQSNKLI